MNHKPMLASDAGDVSTLTYPMIASPKLDGVRAIITAEGVVSRSLKPIPNRHVQELFRALEMPVGLDGELIVGEPTAPDAYRKTVSVVMSDDGDITGLRYYVFDYQGEGTYMERLERIRETEAYNFRTVERVPTLVAVDPGDLAALEEMLVGQGYEGVMLRQPHAQYKHGRSTRREGFLLKLKRFADSEAVVIGATELMRNGNEAVKNALGRTERSSHKAGKTGTGTLGALVVRDVKTGVVFEIGTGFTAEERARIWEDWGHTPVTEDWPWAKYKYFAGGSKDKPRFPVFLGWRNSLDT